MHLFTALLTVLALIGVPARPAQAEAPAAPAAVVDIRLDDEAGMLFASARLSGALPSKMDEAALTGIPLMISYSVRLCKAHPLLPDPTEAETTVHKLLKYNSLQKEFNAIEIVSEDFPDPQEFDTEWERLKAAPVPHAQLFTFTTWAEVEVWLRGLRRALLVSREALPPGIYHAEVRAESDKLRLIPPFNYLFFFLTITSFDTGWSDSSPFAVEKGSPR